MADKKISALTSSTTPLAGTEVLPIVQSGTTKQVSVANLTDGRSITVNNVVASGELVSTTNNARISIYRSAGTNYFDWASGQTLAFGTETSQGGSGRVNKVNFTDAGNIEIATGNMVMNTAAKGINFTANTPAAGMTSQLLNWYEEGTWTPTVTPDTGSFTTVTVVTGSSIYTRVGRLINISTKFQITAIGTGSGGMTISGLPFTINSNFDNQEVTGRVVSTGLPLFGQTSGGTTTLISLAKPDGTSAIVDTYYYSISATYIV